MEVGRHVYDGTSYRSSLETFLDVVLRGVDGDGGSLGRQTPDSAVD